MSTAHIYLAIYDIAAPKRWRRVFKALKKVGYRAQLSVFICRLEPRQMERLEMQLRRHLNPTEDRLAVVDLGPANTAGNRLRALNLMSELETLDALIV